VATGPACTATAGGDELAAAAGPSCADALAARSRPERRQLTIRSRRTDIAAVWALLEAA